MGATFLTRGRSGQGLAGAAGRTGGSGLNASNFNHMKYLLAFAVLILAPLASFAADADTKTTRVFIFAGQSNMVGSDSKAKDIGRFAPFVGLDRPQEQVLYS